MKEINDIFASFITENCNNVIENSVFPVSLEQAHKANTQKEIPGVIRKITGRSASYLAYLKFMTVGCIHE